MKTINKILALVLLFAGLSVVQDVGATTYIHEAVGIYGTDHTANNTWTKTGTSGTGDACETTALSSKVTVTLSKGFAGADAMTVYGKSNLKVQCSTGVKVYRVVFSPATGNSTPNDAQNHLSCNGNGAISQNTWWSSSDAGNSSVTFTGTDADDNFKIVHLNIYIRYEATSAQASMTPTTVTVPADDVESKNFTLTTNLGSFPSGSYFKNKVYTDASSSDIDFDDSNLYDTYSNGSTISTTIYGYNVGTYDAYFILGQQEVGSNNNKNYYARGIELPFTIIVADACTTTPTLTFASNNQSTMSKKRGDAAFTNAATSSPATGTTGQTIAYSSSDTDVATVSSSGQVTLGTKCGTTRITASVESNGTYCSASTYYDLTLSGYTVTLHYPSCAASQPTTSNTDQYGTFSLDWDMSVDGYRFAGWTDHAVTTDPSSVSPLYTSSVSVSANMDLYAVYTKTSSTFTLVDKGSTLPEAGEYVLAGSYSQGITYIMTASINTSAHKIIANTTDYTITAIKTLSCQEESCIWTISGSAGNYKVRNNSTGKYLSSIAGDASSSDLKMALVDTEDDYSVWTISRESNKVPFTFTNNKRNTDSANRYNMMGNGNYFGYYSNGISPFLFIRASSSGTYTTNPDCNATEYKVTIQQQDGGTVTASASANGTWSDPVLNGMHGSETITLTATPDAYHDFTSWTVVSGGVIPSGSTTATFTMPTNDVVIRPNFTPKSYTVTYKDKNNASYSGSEIASSYNSYTYGTGLTLPEVTKTDYVFMGWFEETNCSGTRVNSISTTDSGDKTFYALWMQFTDYLAWCPEPTVTLTNTTSNIGDKEVYVTGTNGKTIMAVNTLTLNAINLVPSSTVRLTTPDGSGVSFSSSRVKYNETSTSLDVTAGSDGNIDDQTIYVHYSPASAATAGATAAPEDVLVTATYQTNTAYYSSRNVHVRNLPANFAIAVKQGTNWYALPANIESASQPAGVLIDVDETNWTCKGPSALNYSLWPVRTTTGSADQYSVIGEKLRFTGNSDKALYGSTTTTTVNNNSTITEISADVTHGVNGSYEWAVTTAVDGSTWKYTLDAGTDKYLRYYGAANWGTYTSGVNEVYMLPITEITEASLSVMEWGETAIALKCAANTALTSVKIDGTAVELPSLSNISGDIYRLSGLPNLSTLNTYAMKKMVIEVTEGETAKQSILTIPFILTSTNSAPASAKTTIDLRSLAGGSSQEARNLAIRPIDVVVRNGGQLNVTTATNEATPCTFNNLYIYPGGKVDISNNDINVRNVYLRGGFSWLDNKATFLLPQMKVANGRSIVGPGTAGNGIYYDFYGDFNMYYMLALPKDVPAASLTNEENGDDWYANIKYYDGSERVLDPKGNKSWKWITGESTLTRGIGYEVAVKPRSGRTIGILRFPLLTGAWANETDAAPSVTAHGKAGYEATPPTVTANNVGWNLMGNPFFSAFTNNGANMYIYELVQHIENGHWTGTYDFNTEEGYKLKYFTIPNKTDYDYVDVRATDYKLEAFWPFFIQANATGSLTFASANRILRKPLMANNTLREVIIDFSLINGDKEDKAGLNISDNYSDKFDMEDKEKTLDNGIEFMKVYTLMDGYRIAFNSITEATAATLVPVGYIAPKQGEYTFTMPQTLNLSEVEAVYLTDFETGAVTDLVFDDYTFTTAKGQFDERFALTVVLKAPHVATDITEQLTDGTSNLDGVKISSDEGVIILRGLPQGASLWVYDATGKLYDSQKGINGGRIVLPVKVAGAYNVHVKAQGESVTLKTVVR
ncbi:MAG: InlB B-repeat-containing protein [Paludibacteraceae bacterium]|nr:InlB B-repeat-containing protein [Paludibacteraceae bacterium]